MTKLTPRPTPSESGLGAMRPAVDPIESLPILILYPHSRCNCRCTMCDIWQDRRKSEISAADIRALVPELRVFGVRRVVLSGGEPLMHSDLWPICESLRSQDIGITLLSTGILLDRHAANVARYCDEVVVSIDGPAAVHDRIRNVPKAFEKLRRGVGAVKNESGDVFVSGRCTVQRENFRYLRATVVAAHEIELDRISFLAADVSSEAFNRPGGWDTERTTQVSLATDDLPLLEAELTRLETEHADDFQSGFIAENDQKLRARLLQYFSALTGAVEYPVVDCNAPWVSSVIESDGTVRPCYFHDAIGNIHDGGGLDAVLNSAEAVMWRKKLDVKSNPICRRCVCSLALQREP